MPVKLCNKSKNSSIYLLYHNIKLVLYFLLMGLCIVRTNFFQ